MKLNMPRFYQSHVLVVGDVMLDRYWHGGTSRISPEAPVPVVKVENIEDRPGGAGNVALNVAALGAGTSIVAITGEDEAADSLRSRLNAAGVYCDFLPSDGSQTITKLRVISQHQQLIRMDFEQKLQAQQPDEFLDRIRTRLPYIKLLILSDYAKGTLADPQQVIDLAKKSAIPVLVDPKGGNFMVYKGATLMTPNINEFEAVVGNCDTEQVLVEKGLQLLKELEIGALLITRGEYGMTLLRENEPELHFPARAREVYDVTGAGDTVISTLAASLAAGEQLPQAVALANLAAGIVVGKLGTAAISGPELRRAISREEGSEKGLMSREQLKIAVDDARAHGERIVMTNGCFDIIHAGHVGYLNEARQLGDRLIVAVNDDDSVSRIKGQGRPINPVERRKAVLAAFEAVDWVVSFMEETPEQLLELIKPDILVKGGDYTNEQVVGHQIVKSYGGKVKVLSFLDNCSTSAIVDKIKEN